MNDQERQTIKDALIAIFSPKEIRVPEEEKLADTGFRMTFEDYKTARKVYEFIAGNDGILTSEKGTKGKDTGFKITGKSQYLTFYPKERFEVTKELLEKLQKYSELIKKEGKPTSWQEEMKNKLNSRDKGLYKA